MENTKTYLVRQQQILRFQVAVDHSLRMEVFQGGGYLSPIEAHARLAESFLALQMEKEFTYKVKEAQKK
jgi:hypothetical protein